MRKRCKLRFVPAWGGDSDEEGWRQRQGRVFDALLRHRGGCERTQSRNLLGRIRAGICGIIKNGDFVGDLQKITNMFGDVLVISPKFTNNVCDFLDITQKSAGCDGKLRLLASCGVT